VREISLVRKVTCIFYVISDLLLSICIPTHTPKKYIFRIYFGYVCKYLKLAQ